MKIIDALGHVETVVNFGEVFNKTFVNRKTRLHLYVLSHLAMWKLLNIFVQFLTKLL